LKRVSPRRAVARRVWFGRFKKKEYQMTTGTDRGAAGISEAKALIANARRVFVNSWHWAEKVGMPRKVRLEKELGELPASKAAAATAALESRIGSEEEGEARLLAASAEANERLQQARAKHGLPTPEELAAALQRGQALVDEGMRILASAMEVNDAQLKAAEVLVSIRKKREHIARIRGLEEEKIAEAKAHDDRTSRRRAEIRAELDRLGDPRVRVEEARRNIDRVARAFGQSGDDRIPHFETPDPCIFEPEWLPPAPDSPGA
jgi:hypothetical protein